MSYRILTIAPYRILPPKTGGQQAIVHLHDYLGRLCADEVVSTSDNEAGGKYSFRLHGVFPASPKRYLPYNSFGELLRIGKAYDVNQVICEHPYMALKAMRLAGALKAKWFLRSHNIESERFRVLGKKWWRVLRAYEQYAMRKADGVLFITEEDARWAQQNFGLKPARCHVVPYGTTFEKRPVKNDNKKHQVATNYNIDACKPWLYFLGALDYEPNRDAVRFILDELMPRLDRQDQAYEILVAGKGLDPSIQERISRMQGISYTGFVTDLDEFITSCDVMLNPVLTGGGIKTKAVEALGYNKRVVSMQSGAAGLLPEVCGNNLRIAGDYDWDAFTDITIRAMRTATDIPDSFYEHYYFGNIAKKVLSIIEATEPQPR